MEKHVKVTVYPPTLEKDWDTDALGSGTHRKMRPT